jgi:cytochrome c peroxidase
MMGSMRRVSAALAVTALWAGCQSGAVAPVPGADAALESGAGADGTPDDSPQDDAPGAVDAGSDAAADTTSHPADAADGAADAGAPPADASADAGDAATGLEKTDAYPPVVYPAENPYSDVKALLGKVLFWEEQLGSKNNQACGTCHRASAGGSDPRASEPQSLGAGPDKTFGTDDDVHGGRGIPRCDSAGQPISQPPYGLAPQVTVRKPPTAFDAMFADELFWDGRARSEFVDPVTGAIAIARGGALESQAAGPPVNNVEMSCEGYTWRDIETKLVTAKPLAVARNVPKAMADFIGSKTYPQLFMQVYGAEEITARKILFAIATYERTLVSNNTAWDVFNGGQMRALNANQQAGLALFNTKARCNKCHPAPLFTDNKFHNIGLNDPMLDPGRSAISGKPEDLGRMRTPTLRNVGLRAPGGMMHSGAGNGANMDAVMNTYNMGGLFKNNIDEEMQMLNLTQDETDKLIDFMVGGLTDPRVQSQLPPFDSPKLSTEP